MRAKVVAAYVAKILCRAKGLAVTVAIGETSRGFRTIPAAALSHCILMSADFSSHFAASARVKASKSLGELPAGVAPIFSSAVRTTGSFVDCTAGGVGHQDAHGPGRERLRADRCGRQ